MVAQDGGRWRRALLGALAGALLAAAYAALALFILSTCHVASSIMGGGSDGLACGCATSWALPVLLLAILFDTPGAVLVVPFAFAGAVFGAVAGWSLGRRTGARAALRSLVVGAVPALGAILLLLFVGASRVVDGFGERRATRAARGSDAGACAMLRDELERDTCYLGVALRTKDASTCDGASSAIDREACRAKVSALLHGGTECDAMRSEMARDVCWSTAAAEAADGTQCLRVRDRLERGACVREVARRRKDEATCLLLPVDEQGQCRAVVREAMRP